MLNEENIVIGGLYRVIKSPPGFGDNCALVGQMGKAKWNNYRGVCLVFSDHSGYVIDYDCLEPADAKQPKPKKPFRDVPTIETVVCSQFRYRLAKMPDIFPPATSLLGRVGSMCEILWADGSIGQIGFQDGDCSIVSLKCLEDIGG
jgi:hypothetical protein